MTRTPMTLAALSQIVAPLAWAQTVAPAARGTLRLGGAEEESEYVDESATVADEPAAPAVTVQAGDVHVVQGGETLWSLSQRYLGTSDAWPKLWSFNPQVTNPHYIYPGETIRLGPGAEPIIEAAEESFEMMPEAPATAPTPAGGPELRLATRLPSDLMFLRQHGFLEEAEMREAGRITSSKEEKIMLATLDEAYVQLPSTGDAKAVEAGGSYAAYRMVREIVHPHTEARLGYLVEVLGTVKVHDIDARRLARVTIIDAENPIERESTRIGPLRKRFHQIQPRKNEATVEGMLVGSLREATLIGTDALVMIDRGAAQGVRNGNRFLIVAHGDGLQKTADVREVEEEEDQETVESYPPEATGVILVLEARHSASIGLVTKLTRETRVGARVVMRKGY